MANDATGLIDCVTGLASPSEDDWIGDMLTNANADDKTMEYLIQPKVRTTRYGLNSLRYDGARIWNKLHNDFKVDDYYDFKRLLKNEIADCNCNTCMFCMIKHL